MDNTSSQYFGIYSDTELFWLKNLIDKQNFREVKSLVDFVSSVRKSYVTLKDKERIALFALSFIAPTYVAYAKFVLTDAKKRGLKKLFFINRDSYIIWKIAEILNVDEISLSYLFLSRRALSVPYLRSGDKNRLEMLTGVSGEYQVGKINIDDIAFRLNMTEPELLQLCGLSGEDWMVSNFADAHAFIDIIMDCKPLLHKLKTEGDTQFDFLQQYLKQENLLNTPAACGIIDVGWTGTSRAMLSALIKEMGGDETPIWYYFGTEERSLSESHGAYVSFTGNKYRKEPHVPLLENYFSLCPYGSVKAFDYESDGSIIPVLSKGATAIQNDVIDVNVQVCCAVAQYYKKHGFEESFGKKWSQVSLDLLDTFSIKDVDYSILSLGKTYEGRPLVRKSKLRDKIKLCLTEGSAMDRLNLYCTHSHSVATFWWNFTNRCYKIRWMIKHYLNI